VKVRNLLRWHLQFHKLKSNRARSPVAGLRSTELTSATRHPPEQHEGGWVGSCHCSAAVATSRSPSRTATSRVRRPQIYLARSSHRQRQPSCIRHTRQEMREKILCKFQFAEPKCSRNLGACCRVLLVELHLRRASCCCVEAFPMQFTPTSSFSASVFS
jgi:hypothetical protein